MLMAIDTLLKLKPICVIGDMFSYILTIKIILSQSAIVGTVKRIYVSLHDIIRQGCVHACMHACMHTCV